MNTYDVSDPSQVEAQQIAQRQKLAELMMQQATSAAPVYSKGAGVARMLAGLLSGVQSRSANEEQMALAQKKQSTKRSEMDAILTAAESGEGGRANLAKLLARSSDPSLSQAGLSLLLKGPGKVEWKDAGDKLVAVDETGRPTGQTMPKGNSPDTVLTHGTPSANTRLTHETPSAGTLLTHNTPSAGAKLADERTRSEGAANRGVTLQGQERTDVRARDANVIAQGGKAREDIDGIRKEFNALPEVKNYKEAVPVLQAARKAKDDPAGDLALVYAVGKVLDPNSVVREGEMTLVLKSGSVLERVMGAARVNFGKGRLTPEMRQRLTGMLEQRVGEYEGQYQNSRKTFEDIAKTRGYDPGQIFSGSPGAVGGVLSPEEQAELAALRAQFGKR